VEDERYRCTACGEEDFYTPGQANALHARALAAIRAQENLLSPEQIRTVREGLGLTQAQFEKLLGVGPKTVVRWERGRVLPNTATDRLIRLVAAHRENAHILAAIHGVVLEGPSKRTEEIDTAYAAA
jgi:HTH-type transcriptional regulator/antitoxin MqsA